MQPLVKRIEGPSQHHRMIMSASTKSFAYEQLLWLWELLTSKSIYQNMLTFRIDRFYDIPLSFTVTPGVLMQVNGWDNQTDGGLPPICTIKMLWSSSAMCLMHLIAAYCEQFIGDMHWVSICKGPYYSTRATSSMKSVELVIPLHFISWVNSFSDIIRKCFLAN